MLKHSEGESSLSKHRDTTPPIEWAQEQYSRKKQICIDSLIEERNSYRAKAEAYDQLMESLNAPDGRLRWVNAPDHDVVCLLEKIYDLLDKRLHGPIGGR